MLRQPFLNSDPPPPPLPMPATFSTRTFHPPHRHSLVHFTSSSQTTSYPLNTRTPNHTHSTTTPPVSPAHSHPAATATNS